MMNTLMDNTQPETHSLAENTSWQNGYLYRLCPVDPVQLRQLVTDLVGSPGWTFGGASVWDFDLQLADRRRNLRPITPIDPAQELDVRGDFGHAFSRQAEVRWKRLAQERYDVLVLSETPQVIAHAHEIRPETIDNQTQALVAGVWRVATEAAVALVQADHRPGIRYCEYRAPNGVVQFVRYREVQG